MALFPANSVAHQLLLAFILVVITTLWLPLFALTRPALPVFAVPGLLPMAFVLLTSPQPPQTTMGSRLLLLIGVFAAAAHTTRRIFFAEAAARRELYAQATQDGLVGLANRAEFHRRAQTLEIMGERPYAMLVIDLDHFKEVNDTAGHAAGDELLRRIGGVLKDAVRKEDLAARLGGDEFAILMHDCSAADAAQVAANVLERIRAFALTAGPRRRRMSASIGIACSADLCASPGKLLEAADQACYAAKRGGRNRVEVATSLNEPAAPAAGRAHFAFVSDVPA
jgi:diguanylate cyclase (GGDEF)-like protein